MQITKDFSEADLMSEQASKLIWKLWIFILPNIIIVMQNYHYHYHQNAYYHFQKQIDTYIISSSNIVEYITGICLDK